MKTDETLNELLVKLFQDIMEIEGKCLITGEFCDISCNDFHILEAVGTTEPKTMTTTAKLMGVTTGTLTKAMDALTEKGYVVRERGSQDKRIMWLSLTEKGKRAHAFHARFHSEMIAKIKEELTEKETEILVCALERLIDYFRTVYAVNSMDQVG